jgi:hypothetical protein
MPLPSVPHRWRGGRCHGPPPVSLRHCQLRGSFRLMLAVPLRCLRAWTDPGTTRPLLPVAHCPTGNCRRARSQRSNKIPSHNTPKPLSGQQGAFVVRPAVVNRRRTHLYIRFTQQKRADERGHVASVPRPSDRAHADGLDRPILSHFAKKSSSFGKIQPAVRPPLS